MRPIRMLVSIQGRLVESAAKWVLPSDKSGRVGGPEGQLPTAPVPVTGIADTVRRSSWTVAQ